VTNDKDEALRLAWTFRESFRERGLFTTTEYRRVLARLLPGVAPADVERIAAAVDLESTALRKVPKGQFDMEGEYMLRGDRRVAKAMSLYEHMKEAIALLGEHLAGAGHRN
jgi:hypothetical protein